MSLLSVVEYPDPILTTPTELVAEVDDAIRQLINDMFETMYYSHGVGLAANQVGVSKRLFVMDMTEDKSAPMVFVNPEIVEQSGEISYQEGCLSFPGLYVDLVRPKSVTVQALDRDGKAFTFTREDYWARCLLHEIDHLDGVTFLDHFKPVKRKLLEAKLVKLRKRRKM